MHLFIHRRGRYLLRNTSCHSPRTNLNFHYALPDFPRIIRNSARIPACKAASLQSAEPPSFAKALQRADSHAKTLLPHRASGVIPLSTKTRSRTKRRVYAKIPPFFCFRSDAVLENEKQKASKNVHKFGCHHTLQNTKIYHFSGDSNRPGMQSGSCTGLYGNTNWAQYHNNQFGCYWFCCRDLHPEPNQKD